MPLSSASEEAQYSTPYVFIFVFNLVVGVGMLSLPYSFAKAGIVRRNQAHRKTKKKTKTKRTDN